MKKYLVIGFLIVVSFAVYGLDHGIYIGTTLYRYGPAPCCPKMGADTLKKCRYLFVTGVSEILAHDGLTEGTNPPFSGYCNLFAQ